jgi:hypothetical protein
MFTNTLTIGLAQSAVFLNAGYNHNSRGRRQRNDEPGPPSMLRGLLTLHLVKPTRISSIEIELEGKARSGWREGE